ncbi:MAG: sigma-70 family RNA polymerase sigma factor [Oscillospiraceae bacterium]|nr:sigma-70 family RNA polymerase sigma factor [Oscillospiraceae bacterium]
MLQVSREELIENNLGLVHSCAHKFKGKGIEYDDLFQAGCIGLIKASDAFDRERGVRFSTYAVPVILGEIRRLFRDGGAVKVSRSLKELSMKVVRERDNFSKKEGREPSLEELAQLLNTDKAQIAHALSSSMPPISLTYDEDDGGGQIDLPVPSPEEYLADRISLSQVLEQLEARDRQLIYFRYFMQLTQSVTAEKLGMTQVQVSRREKKILQIMRNSLGAIE